MQSGDTQHPCLRTLVLILSAVLLAHLGAAICPNSAQAAYTFTGGGTATGTATGDAATGTLYLEQFGGLVYHSTDGVVFSPDWGGGLTIAAAAASTVNVTLSTGNGSILILGGVLSPASALQAAIRVVAPLGNTTDQTIIDDSLNSSPMTYVVDTQPGFITALGINYDQSASAAFVGGVILKGSSAGSVYNIKTILHPAISSAEPFIAIGGAGNDTFLIPGPLLSTLGSPVTIDGGGGVNTLDFTGTTDALVMTLNGAAVTGVTNLTATNIQSLVGGDNSDTFTVMPSATTAYDINGGLPNPPASPGDALIVDASGTTNPAFSSTSTPTGLQGSFTFGNRQPVNFQKIESLPAGGATHFAVIAPPTVPPDSPFTFTVTALDAFNTIATGYGGTVHFTSTDAQATLPANSTLTNGTGTFTATLRTLGTQTITAVDTVNASIIGTSNIAVIQPVSAPTITECGIFTMSLLLGGSGIYFLRRRRMD
jgi:hypothetical protein